MSDNQNDGGSGNASGDGGSNQQGQSQQNQNDGGTQGQQGGAGDGQQQGSGDQQGQSQGAGDKGAQGQGNQQQGDGQQDDGAKGYWPDDWREKMAEGDDKFLETLKRYASPLAFRDAFKEQRKLISSGKLKSALPENATPEQLAAWRADNGIPESPDKYDTTIAEGHVWGEADKPLIDSFAKAAHDANMTPAAVKSALKWYGDLQAKQVEQQQNADAEFKKANVDELREEWGGEYRMNLRIVDEFFDSLPDGLGELLVGARDANGRPLAANAKLARWAAQQQREANPYATVLPGAGVNSMQAMQSEMEKIEAAMGDRSSEYWTGEKVTKDGRTDTKMALRYRELLQAKERAGKRAA